MSFLKKNNLFLSYGHAILSIALAIFFLDAAYGKFGPVKLRDKNIKIENRETIVNQVIVAQDYSPPYGYDLTMNTFRFSGFYKIIGMFQLVAGLLMLFPPTRLAGLCILFPIILNIFLMHVFFDNRLHENVETGILLGITTLLLLFYYKRLLPLIWKS